MIKSTFIALSFMFLLGGCAAEFTAWHKANAEMHRLLDIDKPDRLIIKTPPGKPPVIVYKNKGIWV
jgi:hypothetical protein